jgi:hypothetical protein
MKIFSHKSDNERFKVSVTKSENYKKPSAKEEPLSKEDPEMEDAPFEKVANTEGIVDTFLFGLGLCDLFMPLSVVFFAMYILIEVLSSGSNYTQKVNNVRKLESGYVYHFLNSKECKDFTVSRYIRLDCSSLEKNAQNLSKARDWGFKSKEQCVRSFSSGQCKINQSGEFYVASTGFIYSPDTIFKSAPTYFIPRKGFITPDGNTIKIGVNTYRGDPNFINIFKKYY